MSDRRLPGWLAWLLKIAVGGGLVAYTLLSGRLDPAAVWRGLAGGYGWLFIGIAASVLVPFTAGVRWWWLLRLAGAAAPLSEAVRICWTSAFFNTFLPGATGGDVLRIYSAAKALPERRAEAVLTVFADRLTGLLSLAALALAVLALNYEAILRQPVVRDAVIAVGAVVAATLCLLAFLLSRRMRRLRARSLGSSQGAVARALRRLDEALVVFRGRPLVLLACAGISLLAHLAAMLTLYAGGRAVGEAAIAFRQYMFLAPLILAVNGIPASPGGVGQGEGFADLLFKSLGSTSGAEAFLLFRVMTILAWSAGGVLYLTGSLSLRTGDAAD